MMGVNVKSQGSRAVLNVPCVPPRPPPDLIYSAMEEVISCLDVNSSVQFQSSKSGAGRIIETGKAVKTTSKRLSLTDHENCVAKRDGCASFNDSSMFGMMSTPKETAVRSFKAKAFDDSCIISTSQGLLKHRPLRRTRSTPPARRTLDISSSPLSFGDSCFSMKDSNRDCSARSMRVLSFSQSRHSHSDSSNSNLFHDSNYFSFEDQADFRADTPSQHPDLSALSHQPIQNNKPKWQMAGLEIFTSEQRYVEDLHLFVMEFTDFISSRNCIPADACDLMESLKVLMPVLNIHKELLAQLDVCIKQWTLNMVDIPVGCSIALVIKKHAPFFKASKPFIEQKAALVTTLLDCCKKSTDFNSAVLDFEKTHCNGLKLFTYFDVVNQRICKYHLLLKAYFDNLPEGCREWETTKDALALVKAITSDINKRLCSGDSSKHLLEIQEKLVGCRTGLFEPSRFLIKDGKVRKQSRKETQERFLFLFSDVLIYAAPFPTSAHQLQVRNEIPLTDIISIEINAHEDFATEFHIHARIRSLILMAQNVRERQSWVDALREAVANAKASVRTFPDRQRVTHLPPVGLSAKSQNVRAVSTKTPKQSVRRDDDCGNCAPVWIPDERVSMCLHCEVPFTLFRRRHHCRGCGKVICGQCCGSAPLVYLDFAACKVCPKCYAIIRRKLLTNQSSPARACALLAKFRAPPNQSVENVTGGANTEANTKSTTGYLFWKQNEKWRRHWVVVSNEEPLLAIFLAEKDTRPIAKYVLINSVVSLLEETDTSVTFSVEHTNANPLHTPAGNAGGSAENRTLFTFRCDSSKANRWIQSLNSTISKFNIPLT